MARELWFDRSASPMLIDALGPGGDLEWMVQRRKEASLLLDLQFRRSGANLATVSVYAGLSAVLSLDERNGRFRLRSHATYRVRNAFDEQWGRWFGGDELRTWSDDISDYLDRVLADDEILGRLTRREGIVHAAICSGTPIHVVQREVSPSFADQATKNRIAEELIGPVLGALASTGRTDPWWPGVRDRGVMPSPGLETDVVGFDDAGRLLVVEAKPAEELKGLTFAPAQVLVYARAMRRLLQEPGATNLLVQMLQDRVDCGLTSPLAVPAVCDEIVPVVAVGAGPMSPVALERLATVHDALAPVWATSEIGGLEVWFLDEHGAIDAVWRPGEEPPPAPSSRATSTRTSAFATAARAAAAAWKQTTPALTDAARAPAPYRGVGTPLPFCLPIDRAAENLLPDARAIALERFAAAGIPWHQGSDAGPSNHLLSSQVMCANALAPLVDQPDALLAIFGPHLPIEEVIPFGAAEASPFDRSDHVVFEWNGAVDHLGERGGTTGTRGANSTSVDAAIRYRTSDDRIEIALIEWKYTEEYRHHRLSGGAASMQTRYERYRHLYDDPDSPVRTDVVDYRAFFREPLYQLLRQQLLGWRMEQTHELDAQRVVTVVVAPVANHELATSYPPGLPERIGGWLPPEPTVYDLWRGLLRRPDRFAHIDAAELVTRSSPLSDEFKARYGHIAAAPAGSPPSPPTPSDLRDAAETARMVLERVGGDAGVLAQLVERSDQELQQLDPVLARRLHDRLIHIAEDVRRLRADEVFEALSTTAEEASGE